MTKRKEELTSMHIKVGRDLHTKIHVARLQGFKDKRTMQDFVTWCIEMGIDAVNDAHRKNVVLD